ncbi:hypothetical protein LX16_0615 [Stackebrandtia albiflava]|uniref:Uncharacterized protein n=1 Tax=Stackebrandtia albiflava TaxID=406432 RepID=A0A562VAQ3_9ACTN|nr:hypothetical protein [Stackebrandtia albiflava]TWJ14921.1 hypothetical protein LX16_0615 [Stackebrandtia albiflava]
MLSTAAPGDLRTFLARLRRLDPAALVRIRPEPDGGVRLWTVLPFHVLATRAMPGRTPGDVTVRAADLWDGLTSDTVPTRYDGQWRGMLPDPAAPVIEELTAAECQRIGRQAAESLDRARDRARREGRAVGERRLRDTLLDHTAFTVATGSERHTVRLRLVIGLLRMGFAPEGPVAVRRSGDRIGLEGVHGAVWNPSAGLRMLT